MSLWRLFLLLIFVSALALGQEVAPVVPSTTAPKHSPSEITELQNKAKAGDATAQRMLGRAFADGNGVPQSDVQAFEWFQKAAAQGDAEAENEVGIAYSTGAGVEKNKETAVTWYQKAARQGSAAGMFNLGAAYYNGEGAPVDDVSAGAWFLLAQDAGNKSADDAVKRMNSDLRRWQTADALQRVAEMYEKGDTLPQSDAGAVKWYRKAADAGNLPSTIKLATFLILGQGTPQDFTEARRRCDEASYHEFAAGGYCLGLIYQSGLGTPKNSVQAAYWFNWAAQRGNTSAMLRLSQMCWDGDGVKEDREKAYALARVAESVGVPGAGEKKEIFAKQMDPKQLSKGEKLAIRWEQEHHHLRYRVVPPTPK